MIVRMPEPENQVDLLEITNGGVFIFARQAYIKTDCQPLLGQYSCVNLQDGHATRLNANTPVRKAKAIVEVEFDNEN